MLKGLFHVSSRVEFLMNTGYLAMRACSPPTVKDKGPLMVCTPNSQWEGWSEFKGKGRDARAWFTPQLKMQGVNAHTCLRRDAERSQAHQTAEHTDSTIWPSSTVRKGCVRSMYCSSNRSVLMFRIWPGEYTDAMWPNGRYWTSASPYEPVSRD